MPKRFTDTDKWKKPLLRSLDAPCKLLWFYILDDCDHAGIWHKELDIAALRIGIELPSEKELLSTLKDKIIPFDNGSKWFIPDFIEFQYGELNPENRAHNSVIKQLSKYDLIKNNKVLVSPLQGCKDMDMDKDKDKDKDKDVYRKFKHLSLSNDEFKRLRETYTTEQINSILDAIENYKGNKNYTSLNLTARKWLKKEYPDILPPQTKEERLEYLKAKGESHMTRKEKFEYFELLKEHEIAA